MKTVEYLIGDNVLKIIENNLYDFYKNKGDFEGTEPKREVILTTGLAGYIQLDKEIKEKAIEQGLISESINVIYEQVYTGALIDRQDNEPFHYASYTIPFLSHIQIILDPHLDARESDDTINSYIKGWRKASYSYKIVDEKMEGIIELVIK